jgi:hypothetical protein
MRIIGFDDGRVMSIGMAILVCSGPGARADAAHEAFADLNRIAVGCAGSRRVVDARGDHCRLRRPQRHCHRRPRLPQVPWQRG